MNIETVAQHIGAPINAALAVARVKVFPRMTPAQVTPETSMTARQAEDLAAAFGQRIDADALEHAQPRAAGVGSDIEAVARREWDADAKLRAEFGESFATYRAYRANTAGQAAQQSEEIAQLEAIGAAAVASGRARVLGVRK
jgi:hypothetical protein